jgi:parallel beta-helix repeat protein
MRKLALLVSFGLCSVSAFATQRDVGVGRPYATITAALNAAAAGDVINVHTGSYKESPGITKTVTLRAASGESPVLIGHIKVMASNVTISGLEITGWGATASILPGILQDHNSPPLTGLTVTNCKIHGGTGQGGPIDVGGLTGSAAAIRVRYSTKTTISGNDIYGCKKGIHIQSSHSSDGTYANGTLIENNNIHDCPVDGIDLQGQYITVVGNLIYNNIDLNFSKTHPDGIQIISVVTDGYDSVQHLKILRNTVYNHTQNIFVQGSSNAESSVCLDVTVANNVSYNTPAATVHGLRMSSLPGGGVGIAVSAMNGGWIYNNTVFDVTRGIDSGSNKNGTVHVMNNIVLRTYTGIKVGDPNDILAGEFDWNLFYANNEAISWSSVFYSTPSVFHAAVPSQAGHCISGDPKLASPAQPALQAGSAAIAKGVNLSNSCPIDRPGNMRPASGSWDIGSYMYTNAPAPPTNLAIVP